MNDIELMKRKHRIQRECAELVCRNRQRIRWLMPHRECGLGNHNLERFTSYVGMNPDGTDKGEQKYICVHCLDVYDVKDIEWLGGKSSRIKEGAICR